MSSSGGRLSFTCYTSLNVTTVNIYGSWDKYKTPLPLSLLKGREVGLRSWGGTFGFKDPHALIPGSRHWYYFLINGCEVKHDPNKEWITENTTGRRLNILNIPSERTFSPSQDGVPHSRGIPTGRPLSPGKIQHPKPSKPYESRHLHEANHDASPMEGDDSYGNNEHNSNPSSISTHASLSNFSAICRCELYGITKSYQRVKLDCGGSRCGYTGSSSSSECSSENDEESSENEKRTIVLVKRCAPQKMYRRKNRPRSKHLAGFATIEGISGQLATLAIGR